MGRPCIDMAGKKVYFLTVLEKVPSQKTGGARWLCQCDCGNQKIIRGSDLRGGRVFSCGCYNKQINKEKHPVKNIKDKRFGKLIALEETNKKMPGTRSCVWKCICDCGNITYVTSERLQSGNTKSCGCLKSKGEMLISKILFDNNIPFEKEKTFKSCTFNTGALAKFDFWVNNSYIIEFDGKQHFENTGGWNNNKQLEKTQLHDLIKNEGCKNNNIPIIRIPYTIKDINLEDLCLETSSYILS